MDLLASTKICEALSADAPIVCHIAAAFCGRVLRDLGAQVTRIAPDGVDPLSVVKTYTDEPLNQPGGMLDTFLNSGKNRVALSLSGISHPPPELASANIILTDSTAIADAMDANGPRNAQTVIILQAFPTGAAENGLPVEDISLQSMSALADLLGDPTREPLKLGGNQAAYIGGYAAFAGAMGALAGHHSGNGTGRVTLDLLSANFWVNWKCLAAGAMDIPMSRQGTNAEWPVIPCKDGYIALIYTERDWTPLVEVIGDERLKDPTFDSFKGREAHRGAYMPIIEAWCAQHSMADIYEQFQKAGVPGGPVYSPRDLLKDPLFEATGYFKELQGDGDKVTKVPSVPAKVVGRSNQKSTGRKSVPANTRHVTGLPLAGIRVIDLGIITAGAGTSALLADMGADVIKVESSTYPDPFRAWAGASGGDSPLFKFNNRNKRGADIDLKTADGRAKLLELVSTADIVVENFRRGVLDRLGIGFDVLQQANPQIVLGSISGLGETGPGVGHTTFGSTLEALSGLSALTGFPDGIPVISGRNLNYPDQIVCLFAAGAVISGYLAAQTTGKGVHLSIPQREIATYAIGEYIAAASQNVLPDNQLLTGNDDPNAVVQGMFATSDGQYISVSAATDAALTGINTFVSENTTQTFDTLSDALRDAISSLSADMTLAVLRALNVAVFPAWGAKDAFGSAQRLNSTALAKSADGTLVKGFPVQFAHTPMTIFCESPAVGRDTDETLNEIKTT